MNDNKIVDSIKWSSLTEVFAKLIAPISNMILARLLAPEAFGIVAIINMILTGIDIVTDAGFGKYLIQKNFNNENEKKQAENVAFWTNFLVSFIFALLFVVFSPYIARFFKNDNLDLPFKVISVNLLLTSFTSVQQNILRRSFEYRKLFIIRIILTVIPLLVTLPIAYFTRSFWALIIGQITIATANTILLAIFGNWKPELYYSFEVLFGMLSFSFWSSMEAIGHWFIFWIDTIFVSYFFTEYQLGLYKNSQNMIFSIFSIITASMSSVLLSILSRIENEEEYEKVYLNIQRLFTYILVPMCFGLIFFSDSVTSILLGSKWKEANTVFSLGGFMMFFNVLFYSFPAEIFKSKGKPKQLFIVQLQYILLLIPILYFVSMIGFWELVYVRSFSIIIIAVFSLLRLKLKINFDIFKMLKELGTPLLSGLIIFILGIINIMFLSNIGIGFFNSIIKISIVAVFHFIYIYVFFRNNIFETINSIKHKKET